MSVGIFCSSSSRSSTEATSRPSAKRVVNCSKVFACVVMGSRDVLQKYNRRPAMDLTLPLYYAAIERILTHRYPFLLVDRVIELEVDKRIVGIKNVSLNERYLWHPPNGSPVLPPTILTEAVAQVGAILVLAKPENRQRLPFFAGIERVRYRRPVHPGDVVVIEANVVRLRSRMGMLKGVARVNGTAVIEGTMTFALGPPQTHGRR